MKLIQRILTTALCGALCLGILPGAAAPPETQPSQEVVTEAAEPTVEATTEEEMPLLATMSTWSPGEVVNTWEGEPYTSGEAGTSDYLKLFAPLPPRYTPAYTV